MTETRYQRLRRQYRAGYLLKLTDSRGLPWLVLTGRCPWKLEKEIYEYLNVSSVNQFADATSHLAGGYYAKHFELEEIRQAASVKALAPKKAERLAERVLDVLPPLYGGRG